MIKTLLKSIFKLIFLALIFFVAYYIWYIETEKYESSSIVMVKDLSQNQTPSALGSLLGASGSSVVQDSMLLSVYIHSSEMYALLDKEYNLTQYYSSDRIDAYNRLYSEIPLSFYQINGKNLLKKYNKDLNVYFDESSSTLSIYFAHADAKMAKRIVKSIIADATKMLNDIEKQNSTIVLKFLKKLEREKYELFLDSLKNLLAYQNQHHSIDPKIEVNTKSEILASLEGTLVQKEVLYQGKLQYMNINSVEMELLRGEISHIESSIRKIKKEMTGEHNNKKELNQALADFELLKSEVEFNKEVYRQTLTKLEESSVMVNQNRKNLIVISKAKVSDSYSYPNKVKDIITMVVLLSLLYGVIGLILAIVRDHKD
jgi:capsular polysaccharide transport system permease protein